MPPITKNTRAAAPYMMPIFLWSTVKSQLFHPVSPCGRLSAPSGFSATVTVSPASRASGRSSSMIAISVLVPLSVSQVNQSDGSVE